MKRILLVVLLLPVFWCVRLLQECAKIPFVPIWVQHNEVMADVFIKYINRANHPDATVDERLWRVPLVYPKHWRNFYMLWLWARPCPVLPWRAYGLLSSLLGWNLARSCDGSSILVHSDVDLRVRTLDRPLSQPVHGSGDGTDTVSNDGVCTVPFQGHTDLSRSCESPSPDYAHARTQ